jgi:hypothetical protein
MKLGISAGILAVALFAGVGCESNNTAPADQNNGYAGGNGEFGENPVQPGEHSQQRFNQSTDIPPADAQARDRER